jgi:LysM repeat protein
MAGGYPPGPWNQLEDQYRVDDGTLCLVPSPRAGLVCTCFAAAAHPDRPAPPATSVLGDLDPVVDEVVQAYNERLKPSVLLDPDWVRAMILVETIDPDSNARKYDPMQIANQGDFALTVLGESKDHSELIATDELRQTLQAKKHTPRRAGRWDYDRVKESERMDARTSVEAGVAWLFHNAVNYSFQTTETGPEFLYKVVSGDNLSKIARSQGTTVETIRKYSRLKSDQLQIGQELRYKKATQKWAVTRWNSWETAALKYNGKNGAGDPDYLEKVKKNYQKIKQGK